MARVLVIDDDQLLRHAVARMLARGKHEAVEAGDGLEGMKTLLTQRFSVVICDLFMPMQGGIETIQKIREIDAGIPIIAISGALGTGGASPLAEARALGADAAIAKPFDIQTLLDTVEDVLDRREA